MSEVPARSPHIPYLDGARGLAALSVFIYHLFALERWVNTPFTHISNLFINGADAVSFFFVLSGFVLSFKYLAHQPDKLSLSLSSYVNNRFWRIYPAFWITLVMYPIFGQHIHSLSALKILWPNENLHLEATLIHGINVNNGADWSLGIEVAMSAILPFLMLVIVRSRRWFLAMMIMYLLLPRFHSQFLIHFLLGMSIAWYYPRLSTLKENRPKLWRWRWLFLPVALFLFDTRHFPAIYPNYEPIHEKLMKYFFLEPFTFSAIGSAIFLIYFLSSKRAQRVLSFKPILFLGKISYSVYLIQGLWAWIWMPGIMARLQPYVHNGRELFIGCALIGTTGLLITATLSYYFIELPFMRLGKKFYRRFFGEKTGFLFRQ